MIQPTSSEQETAIEDARALLAQHQPAEAARRLHLHLTTRPGTATAYMLLGVAPSGSGEGLRSLQAFEQAVAMESENAAAHYNLGQAYREYGRKREALAEIERALELRPGYPANLTEGWTLAVRLLRRQSREADLRSAVKALSSHPHPSSSPEQPRHRTAERGSR
jgi:tetratricopeptide (TPR) repeat protein